MRDVKPLALAMGSESIKMNQAKGLNPDLDPEKKHQPAVRIPASSLFC
jgi:hypothetical protein